MTNADKIKSMTDEELAKWLDKICNREREDWEGIGCIILVIVENVSGDSGYWDGLKVKSKQIKQ